MNSPNSPPGPGELPTGGPGVPMPPPGGDMRLAVRPAYTALPQPTAAAGSLDVMTILKAFRRCWPLAVGLGLVCALAATAAAWFLLPAAKYNATATLRIISYQPRIIFPTNEPQADPFTYQQTQMALIKSRMVLDAALRDPKISGLKTVQEKEDPVEWLEKDLGVQSRPNSMVITIGLSGERPGDLAALVNAVTEKYQRLVVEAERQQRFERLDYLRKLWTRYQDELRQKRKTLREMVEAGHTANQNVVELENQFLLDAIQAARSERQRIRQEIMTLDFALKTMEASAMVAQNQAAAPPQPGAGPALTAATPLPEAPPPDFGDDDEIVRQLYAQAAAAKQNFDNAMRAAKKGTRDVAAARYKQDLDHAHRALVERKTFLWRRYQEQALRPPAAPGMEGIGAQNTAENTVAGARVKLQALRLYDETLMKDIQQLQEKISILNVSALDIKADEDELRIAEETARSVQNEIQRLEVELTAPPRISVIDPAKTPKTRDETKKIKMTGMAGLGAFGLVVMGITFLEYRARRISSADEVVQNLGLRLVGALPTVPAGGGQRGLKRLGRQVDEHWRSRLVESVDATRTMLLHASRTESIRVVMISSALKGEGKTSLSGHLATSLARAGRKTLLIDCDLRKPDVHKLFDVPPEPGLCEILRGETDPMAVIQPTAAGELYVLTAGRCDPLALQALAQDGARAVFDALLSQFDFLIVDSAPILPVADSLLLAQQVDAVLFSILRDVSCVPHVQSAYERIAGLGARVLGAVVNGTASPSYGYKGYSVYTR